LAFAFAVWRSPFAVRRSPFAVCRLPFAVCRLPFAVWRLAGQEARSVLVDGDSKKLAIIFKNPETAVPKIICTG
jgi:hypothetical protein